MRTHVRDGGICAERITSFADVVRGYITFQTSLKVERGLSVPACLKQGRAEEKTTGGISLGPESGQYLNLDYVIICGLSKGIMARILRP